MAAILVVDDRRTTVRVLLALLRGRGHEVRTLSEGKAALQAIQKARPDLVMLDVSLPGMGGYEVCRQLRGQEATRDLPVIFVSELRDGKDKEMAFAAGGSDYIHKPFHADEVLARVENQVALARLQREIARKTEDLERAHRMLLSLALLDPLTGLASRRHFEESLEQEWRRARRQQTSLGLLLADVDQFKAFVEAYGTESGDDCLRRVAVEISGTLRRGGDLVARCGGDEFGAVLPATEGPGARSVAQEVAERVLGLRIAHRGSPLGLVSLSLGLAITQPAHSKSPSAGPLLSAAAQALQRARAEGGNRIVLTGL